MHIPIKPTLVFISHNIRDVLRIILCLSIYFALAYAFFFFFPFRHVFIPHVLTATFYITPLIGVASLFWPATFPSRLQTLYVAIAVILFSTVLSLSFADRIRQTTANDLIPDSDSIQIVTKTYTPYKADKVGAESEFQWQFLINENYSLESLLSHLDSSLSSQGYPRTESPLSRGRGEYHWGNGRITLNKPTQIPDVVTSKLSFNSWSAPYSSYVAVSSILIAIVGSGFVLRNRSSFVGWVLISFGTLLMLIRFYPNTLDLPPFLDLFPY